VSIYRKAKFSDWLRKSLLFIRRGPAVWVGYCLYIAVVMCLYRMSYALGIFASVVCLLVGVGICKYIDMKHTAPENAVGFAWAVKKSLPLAVILGGMIVICWFIFSALANILNGEITQIPRFFFYWQYSPEVWHRQTTRELAIWLFGYANLTLIFTLLMLASFASWYSYPLMLFKDYTWSQAKESGEREASNHREAIYKTLAFLVFEAILCIEITPLLTPVLYMLSSTFMFISYKDYFES
jgi:hypothetical protein